MSIVYHPIPAENLFACPQCGDNGFKRIQTGYTQSVPCEILLDGKVAVCHYEDEDLDEEDDGARWSRTFECVKCGHILDAEELNLGIDSNDHLMTVDQVDCVAPEDVTGRMVAAHGTRTE